MFLLGLLIYKMTAFANNSITEHLIFRSQCRIFHFVFIVMDFDFDFIYMDSVKERTFDQQNVAQWFNILSERRKRCGCNSVVLATSPRNYSSFSSNMLENLWFEQYFACKRRRRILANVPPALQSVRNPSV